MLASLPPGGHVLPLGSLSPRYILYVYMLYTSVCILLVQWLESMHVTFYIDGVVEDVLKRLGLIPSISFSSHLTFSSSRSSPS